MMCNRCNKDKKIYSKGLCRSCYMFFWKKTELGKTIEKRYLSSNKRKEANRRNMRRFRNVHGKEYFNMSKKKFFANNPDKLILYKEKSKEYDKKYSKKPEVIKKRIERDKRKNEKIRKNPILREISNMKKRKYMKTDTGRAIAKRGYNMRRFRISVLSESYKTKEWMRLLEWSKGICPRCNLYVTKEKLTLDHIMPISLGGNNKIENIQPLCIKCNIEKRIKNERYIPKWEVINGLI